MSGKLPAVDAKSSVRDALLEMKKRRMYHLLVVRGEEVVGIVSAVDAARELIDRLEAAGTVEHGDIVRGFLDSPIESLAVRPVIVVEQGASLRDIARIMIAHRIGCTPIISGDEVVDAVCERDVVKALAESDMKEPVVNYATLRVVYVERDATVIEALGVMVEGGFRRLPVISDMGLAGIVTVYELMLSVAEKPGLLFEPVGGVVMEVARVSPSTPVSEASKTLLESPSGAVMLTLGGVVVGIFTERDAVRVYAEGR